jgi:hypothetical protein
MPDVDVTEVPAALSLRARTWRKLLDDHQSGAHHPLLCATAESCSEYDRVLRRQMDLVERSLRLPIEARAALAERLDMPGPAPLARLITEAQRWAGPVE